jgi:hypothetical protein
MVLNPLLVVHSSAVRTTTINTAAATTAILARQMSHQVSSTLMVQ